MVKKQAEDKNDLIREAIDSLIVVNNNKMRQKALEPGAIEVIAQKQKN